MIRHQTEPMDRPLDPAFVRHRARKRITQAVIALAALTGAFLLLSAWITPSIPRNDLRTAVVDSGLVEASISASGTVVPRFEEAISSPANTRVLQVLRRPGEHLAKGDQFLLLDISESKLALDRVRNDLALNANHAAQLKLDQQHAMADLKSQLRIKDLRLTYLKSKSVQEEKMYAIGASSKDQLEQSKLEEEIARTEQAGLEQSIRNTDQSLTNQLQAISTAIATLKKEEADIQRQLDILSCRAPRDGVLTMVAQEVGSTIRSGEILARLSDLNAYRVDAEISDIHAGTLAKGQRAHVAWNGGTLEGEVSDIDPTIENGTIRFSISLNEKSDSRLRSKLRVDVAVVTADSGISLRLAKGPYLTGRGPQEVFVVRGDRAIRTTATIGVAGFDYVQVLGGLRKGDEVVISEMKDYITVKEIRLK
jgi:HlyD family secretion protein